MIEAALEVYPGRAIVNSINLENGRERIDAVLPLAEEHGAAVVALTIDEAGHGQDRRAQARGRRSASTTSPSTSTACARRTDLRRADLPAHHRRGRLRATRPIETLEGIRLIKASCPAC